jgi:hypothetical protein
MVHRLFKMLQAFKKCLLTMTSQIALSKGGLIKLSMLTNKIYNIRALFGVILLMILSCQSAGGTIVPPVSIVSSTEPTHRPTPYSPPPTLPPDYQPSNYIAAPTPTPWSQEEWLEYLERTERVQFSPWFSDNQDFVLHKKAMRYLTEEPIRARNRIYYVIYFKSVPKASITPIKTGLGQFFIDNKFEYELDEHLPYDHSGYNDPRAAREDYKPKTLNYRISILSVTKMKGKPIGEFYSYVKILDFPDAIAKEGVDLLTDMITRCQKLKDIASIKWIPGLLYSH